jgi:transposase
MTKQGYSDEFKKLAVQKYFSRGNRSLTSLSEEIGISTSMLWHWVDKHKKCANLGGMINISKRPLDWTPEKKLRACFEYEGLSVEEQGEFLRREGLHSSHVAEWKEICRSSLSTKGNDLAFRGELTEANRKVKELERELWRKDRALAEAAALLLLKKKADLIWGTEEQR